MDRGIPTEEVLAQMRRADPPVLYLVGTPKGRLAKLEQALFGLPWHAVRAGVEVKLLPQEQDLYSKPHAHSQRTCDAPTAIEAAVVTAQTALGHAPQPGSFAHEARCRTGQCANRLAPDRYQAAAKGRRLQL